MVITREKLAKGYLQQLVGAQGTQEKILSDEELRDSIAQTLRNHPEKQPVRVFSYGSLIWNPSFHFTQRRLARLHGYRRSFTLWVRVGRGSARQPGLMLGLVPGGSCWGAVFDIAPQVALHELFLVWRREMVTGAYRPVWATVRGAGFVCRAIIFAANKSHPGSAHDARKAQILQALAHAKGQFGSSYEYLTNTLDGLEALGVTDRQLLAYRTQVDDIRKASGRYETHCTK